MNIDFQQSAEADSSRLASIRRVTEKRCCPYNFAEGWHTPFPLSPLPEYSLNLFLATELLYRTMYQRLTPNKHTKRRPCTTTTSSFIVASELPGKNELLTHPTVTQHAVCIRCHNRRNRPEKGVLSVAGICCHRSDLLTEPVARFFYQRAQSILEVMAKLS